MSTENTANGLTATSVTTGALTTGMGVTQWVSENVLLITATCTILSLMLALVFHIINSIINHRRNKIQTESQRIQSEGQKLQRAKLISDWKAQGMTDEQIKSFLDTEV